VHSEKLIIFERFSQLPLNLGVISKSLPQTGLSSSQTLLNYFSLSSFGLKISQLLSVLSLIKLKTLFVLLSLKNLLIIEAMII
jgi:hypothetical protein